MKLFLVFVLCFARSTFADSYEDSLLLELHTLKNFEDYTVGNIKRIEEILKELQKIYEETDCKEK